MKYTNYGKVNAIAKLNNFSIDKPSVKTVNNAIVCNANKTNRMLNINEVHEIVSSAIVGKPKCKCYTNLPNYIGIGNLKYNGFSIHVKKTKYVIYTEHDKLPVNDSEIKLFGNKNDLKLRPHTVTLTDTNKLLQCIDYVVNQISNK